MFFIGVSILTEDWRYVIWSFMVSMLAGVPSMINTWRVQKKQIVENRILNRGTKKKEGTPR